MGRWSRSAMRKAASRRAKLLRKGNTPPRPLLARAVMKAALLGAALGAVLILAAALAGCATVGTCTQPITAQAISDGAAVLVCANNGKTLASCEEAQLAMETSQLIGDLVCGEVAIAAAAKGDHTTAAAK